MYTGGDTTCFLGMWLVESSHGSTVARVLPGPGKNAKRWPVRGHKKKVGDRWFKWCRVVQNAMYKRFSTIKVDWCTFELAAEVSASDVALFLPCSGQNARGGGHVEILWTRNKEEAAQAKNRLQFFILMTAVGGRPKPELCFLPGRLRWTLLPK